MSNVLPSPSLELAKPLANFAMPIRIVATSQVFAIRVTWGETLKQPIEIAVRVKLHADEQSKPRQQTAGSFDGELALTREAMI